MHIKPLEYRVHMALLACISLGGLFSTVKINATITAWTAQRDSTQAHQAQITAIENRADIAQAAIDNKVDQYGSVSLGWYTCDPGNEPLFDSTPFVDDPLLEVSDSHDRVIGTLAFGVFYFSPENCTL
ncbi:hypothetical protein [Leptothoe sp. PORK10 BA2]|uniref:hypothetical protein n=1 Tax=Leptothoe sp. PORK10 BA2 TaxID=3110254 RepID=UPI002B1F0333|nr:hypothetical protein [Leptothoe sp. PORK10 BA2]MEA5464616.1 hypothetical protein [Leptothoe sp. PORK10 BA2]